MGGKVLAVGGSLCILRASFVGMFSVGHKALFFWERCSMMERDDVLAKLERICTPVLDRLGYRLVEWEYIREGGGWVIRLYIDKEGGITIDDCELASHALEDLVEVELMLNHPYSFEVSSPGVYRPLRRQEDFARYRGAIIRLKTRYPLNGRSNYKGVIEDVTGDAVSMVVDGMRFRIPFEALAKARLEEGIMDASSTKNRRMS